jgi:hypothetical protein
VDALISRISPLLSRTPPHGCELARLHRSGPEDCLSESREGVLMDVGRAVPKRTVSEKHRTNYQVPHRLLKRGRPTKWRSRLLAVRPVSKTVLSTDRDKSTRIGAHCALSPRPAKDARAGSRLRRTEGKRQSVRFRFYVTIPLGEQPAG